MRRSLPGVHHLLVDCVAYVVGQYLVDGCDAKFVQWRRPRRQRCELTSALFVASLAKCFRGFSYRCIG